LQKTSALAIEANDFALCDLRDEIQASLALNRAVLQALSTLSVSMAAAAEGALDDELALARQAGRSSRVVELLEEARDSLRDEQDARMGELQLALLAAADALPELQVRRGA